MASAHALKPCWFRVHTLSCQAPATSGRADEIRDFTVIFKSAILQLFLQLFLRGVRRGLLYPSQDRNPKIVDSQAGFWLFCGQAWWRSEGGGNKNNCKVTCRRIRSIIIPEIFVGSHCPKKAAGSHFLIFRLENAGATQLGEWSRPTDLIVYCGELRDSHDLKF